MIESSKLSRSDWDSQEVFARANVSLADSVPGAVWFFRTGVNGLVKFRNNKSEIAKRYQVGVFHPLAFLFEARL
jgi:hypothetical protein